MNEKKSRVKELH